MWQRYTLRLLYFLCPCRSLTNFFPEDLVILYVFYLKNAFTHGQLHIYLFLEHIKRDATYELAIIPEFSSIWGNCNEKQLNSRQVLVRLQFSTSCKLKNFYIRTSRFMIRESPTPCKNSFPKRVFAKMGGDLVILIPVRLKEPKPASSANLM